MTHLAADLTFLDLAGRTVTTADVVGDRPTVMVFLRHFGCLLCAEHAAQIEAMRPAIEARGAKVAFVGNGNVGFARAFAEDQHVRAPLVVSPDRTAYDALGFEKGVASTFAPSSVLHAVRAFFGGHRQGPVQGAPWQQGGVAVVLPGGAVPWVYRSREAGDHPPEAAILAAIPG